MDYVIARKTEDSKNESRWIYLNDMTCNLAKASNKGFEKIKYYSEIIKNIKEDRTDRRTEEEIINDTLNLFK